MTSVLRVSQMERQQYEQCADIIVVNHMICVTPLHIG